ncbi:MAG: ATP-binding cassette domain-containing protein, partial [Lachnospiraceae bacterium]|nr:ATP-binding cassette domain-containing protein [Lachnospiraceae bacterium]
MEYCLTTEALCKEYRHTKALDGLSMHVPRGSIYGFVGKNGAGKTTLIRVICGLQKVSSGEYTLYGVKNTDKRIEKARGRMGAIVEASSVYMDMTAEDNLKLQYRVLGLPSYEG